MPADRPTAHRAPGDRLVVIGGVVFGVGAIACIVTVIPLLVGADALPLAVYLLAILAPVGFGIALSGLLVSARARRLPRVESTPRA